MAGLKKVRGMMVINGSKIEEDMIMKNIFRISALMCAMAFLTTSCVKDELFDEPQQKPAAVGEEIIFGSRAGFENSDKTTRTVYSGETYTKDGVTFERIDWIDSTKPEVMDRVQIYSPQAANGPVADYFVYANSQADDNNENTVDIEDEGYLVKVQDNALQWGRKEPHKFYAMYPATSSFKEEVTIAMGIRMDTTTLHGVVPSAQVPGTKGDKKGVEKVDGYGYVAHPNMDYAYMAAKAVASPEDGAVSLDFVPIVTALEIELLANQIMTISELYVSGDHEVADSVQYLAGAFTADLRDSTWTATYPTCENQATYTHTFTNDKGESQTLTLNQEHTIYYSLGGQYTINKGEKLKFTVFLRPGVDYKNLKVGFSETGAAYKNSTIGDKNNTITIPQHRKTKILGINLPTEKIEWDASNWMEALPDERGSFSYAYSGSNPQYYRQQNTTFNIDAQWKAGIRAFEIVVDRVQEYISDGLFSGYYEARSLNDEESPAYVKCNKTSVGVTFDTAMQGMEDAVKNHPNECAVVIITYQPEGNSPNRNASMFAESLKLWWDGIGTTRQAYYKKLTPNATLRAENAVQGKVLVIVRPNQKDEKDGGNFDGVKTQLGSCPFVLIDGCGTAKDRWGARGYKINGSVVADISNSVTDNNLIIETYMGQNSTLFDSTDDTSYTSGSYTITRPAIGSDALNFGFDTETVGTKCWYQEWARVAAKTETFIEEHWYGNTYYYWFESLNEKKSNIEQTFTKALSFDPSKVAGTQEDPAFIFINSLCGYLIDSGFSNSYTHSTGSTYGGGGGNIQALAKGDGTDANSGLNAWFEAMVNDSQMEQSTGPTGIIMMDYVEPTDLVIGTIISNNFKYNK